MTSLECREDFLELIRVGGSLLQRDLTSRIEVLNLISVECTLCIVGCTMLSLIGVVIKLPLKGRIGTSLSMSIS